MTRKLISIVLAMCMIMSCFAISGMSVSAATANDTVGSVAGGQTLYFQPSNNWKEANARFAMYYFNNSSNTNGWVNLTAVAGASDLYEAAVPNGNWDGVIFARMNPSTTDNNWDNKWNQTADLTSVPSGKNKFICTENAWDNFTGSWDTYTPATPEPEETTAAPVAETTVAPEPAETTEAPVTGTITVYFTDAQYWGAANVYYWGTTSDPQWPGNAMTYSETNDYGQTVYTATIPANVTGIIFNGNGKQTVDIESGIENGALWYTTGEMDGANYKVAKVDPSTPAESTAAPEPEETTVPEPEGTTVPEPSKYMYVSPGAMGSVTQYALWTWDDGQEGEFAYVQRFQYVGGLKDNACIVAFDKDGKNMTWNDVIAQSVDFKVQSGKYVQAINEFENNKYKVSITDSWATETTVAPEETTVTPEPEETTVAPTGTITVYFTDAMGWGAANVYYWGTTADPEWPGSAMTVHETNDFGQKVYKATIPAAATAIIFNGNGKQTVDITTGIENGALWYTTGEMDGANYKVSRVAPPTPAETTVAPEPEETTVAPEPEGTTVPEPSKYMYVSPGAMGSVTQYALWTWDDGQEGEFAYVQRFQYVGGLKDNACIVAFNKDGKNMTWNDVIAQSVDFKVQSGKYVQAINEFENNKYKVSISDSWATETTAAPEETTLAPEPEETTVAPTGTITVYFTDAQNWGAANAYYWGTDADPQWPGSAMTVHETNDFGQKVYKATIPAAVTGIIFNGNGKQTVDITTGIENGALWYTTGEMDGANYKVSRVAPPTPAETTVAPEPEETTLAPEPEETTLAPEPEETTKAPVTDTITVYFTDAQYWGAANVYYWGTDADPQWPGSAMTVHETNDFGQTVYTATIPAAVTGIIFNGNGKQTVNIETGIEDGALWYTTGEMDGANYKVNKVAPTPVETTVAPEPEETTIAPEPEETTVAPVTDTITVLFTDAQNFGAANVYYWGTDADPQWPGEAMTESETNDFGQKVYSATIPANVTGIIFNGNGKQTVDITTGIENGAQWYTTGEMDGANYKVNKVEKPLEPTTEEPTTEEPTTEEPTTEEPTEEPTTVAPTTEEPTTEEPTVAPDPTNTTIKLVVPNNINSAYAWNDARLYYNFTGKTADNQYINMTQTNDTYYMTQLGTGITEIAAAGAWKVFTVTVTPEQAAQIDGAIWVGFANGNNRNKTVSQKSLNVLKAGVGEFDASYSNNKASIAEFDGYTFIVKDNNSATSPYTSFIGYWTSDFTTVMMAAPMSDNSYSNWNAVSLSYGESGDSETAIPMFNTGTTTKVADIGDMSTLRTGRWYIYALTLDAAQTAEVNAAKRVGFVKPGGNNRTAGSKNVLKAKTNSFDGNYNATARTLEELEGQLFVVKAKASASSIVIYNGEWQTEDVYTAGNNDTVTIYFAAPKGADNTTAGWNTGVELYYGATTAYQNCARMEMTPVNGFRNVSIDGTGLTTLKSGDWDLYAIELNAEEISTIDAATTVGFIKKGSYNRTSALYTKNIAKAPTTEDGTYSKNKQSIETFDGKTFVINTCADSKNERTSYMGIWS